MIQYLWIVFYKYTLPSYVIFSLTYLYSKCASWFIFLFVKAFGTRKLLLLYIMDNSRLGTSLEYRRIKFLEYPTLPNRPLRILSIFQTSRPFHKCIFRFYWVRPIREEFCFIPSFLLKAKYQTILFSISSTYNKTSEVN